ncbi:LOW QUALITY PROTEIN: betaine--homocysteine S-methyltransferase 1-like [Patiria miniata]|uniref:Hcy-binding domain-containing protein n=1 Tax=Patiria miniata TaxID=46514 RepID=A0A914A7C6_PATMI|nr:LOW QUALITY PROTEIN: betaine--homocysteine S-methyltransferase 1-like [Patiria miniata]
MSDKKKVVGLLERLSNGGRVLCAEGYLFVFERRGYLKAGAFVPEVVPEVVLVRQQYQEFVHAGSEVVLAFTYYAHREKLALIDRGKDLEVMNRQALRLAREVADQTGTLMAGNICNTTLFDSNDPNCQPKIDDLFKEQIEWAVEEGADYIVGESFGDLGEAMMALQAIKKYGKGLPAVITMGFYQNVLDGKLCTLDGVEMCSAFQQLEAAGADVLGLNCARGPATTLPLLKQLKKVLKVPIAALPVVYRTTEDAPNMQALKDPLTGKQLFPTNLDCAACTRDDIVAFGEQCLELGIQYVGLCCGNAPHYTRTLSEALGRHPPASRYSPDMRQHFVYGDDAKLRKYNQSHVKSMLT